ncbi:MAG TPA: hypothetical protein VHH36_00500 [Candidatus Thermoplasmatota archaeon]|nr:hypothetical protein [Candidatus Thermoplasmatota archaeon]
MRHAAVLAVFVLAAGCASHPHGGGLDTGDIPPGEERSLVFAASAGIHCHPHPSMTQRVTVEEDAPREVHVHVLDGGTIEEYRFEPAALAVAPGGTVTYHNHGNLTHTATQDAA